MSSMRNAVQRRNHKERSQPKEREKWGMLEKHKDYSLRAKDYNEKKKRLKTLRQKATERNPDEFHFGMMSSRTHDDGRKLADRGNRSLSNDVVKLLKTQDAGYIRNTIQRVKVSRQRLEQDLVLKEHTKRTLDPESKRSDKKGLKHTAFVDTVEDQKEFVVLDPDNNHASGSSSRIQPQDVDDLPDDEEQSTGTLPAGNQKSPLQAGKESLESIKAARRARKRHKRGLEALRAKLNGMKDREQELDLAEKSLEDQRQSLGGKSSGVNKSGVKFKPGKGAGPPK